MVPVPLLISSRAKPRLETGSINSVPPGATMVRPAPSILPLIQLNAPVTVTSPVPVRTPPIPPPVIVKPSNCEGAAIVQVPLLTDIARLLVTLLTDSLCASVIVGPADMMRASSPAPGFTSPDQLTGLLQSVPVPAGPPSQLTAASSVRCSSGSLIAWVA